MVQIREILRNMFGFLISQPLHISLRQLRVMTITVLIVCIDIMYELVEILKTMNTLSDIQAATVISTLAATVLGSIWKGINNLQDSHKKDEH